MKDNILQFSPVCEGQQPVHTFSEEEIKIALLAHFCVALKDRIPENAELSAEIIQRTAFAEAGIGIFMRIPKANSHEKLN